MNTGLEWRLLEEKTPLEHFRIFDMVILDDDPGRDLGLLRLPGHRFFFSPEEVEPLQPEEK